MSETDVGFWVLVSAAVLSPRTFRRLGGRANDASAMPPADASNWRRLTSMVMQCLPKRFAAHDTHQACAKPTVFPSTGTQREAKATLRCPTTQRCDVTAQVSGWPGTARARAL